MLLLRAILNILVTNASPGGLMSCRCLIFSCGECNVISFMFCVALSMDLFVLCV